MSDAAETATEAWLRAAAPGAAKHAWAVAGTPFHCPSFFETLEQYQQELYKAMSIPGELMKISLPRRAGKNYFREQYLNQPKGAPMTVEVNGPDLNDVKRQIMRGERQYPYLSIEPLMNYDRDLPQMRGARALPTVRFAIRWSGANEMFLREVNSVKELYDVLRPIFKEHEKAKRELDASDRKRLREMHRDSVNAALARVGQAEKQLDTARGDLAEVRRRAPR